MALDKYVSNYAICLETIWLVSKCLGEKPNFREARGQGDLGGKGERPVAGLPVCAFPDAGPGLLIFLQIGEAGE